MYPTLSQQAWKPKTSVKVRFALAQGVFIALIISLLAITLYFPVKQRLVRITDNSYKILVNNVASSVFAPYFAGNNKEVINAVRRVEGQQGVKYVMVVDKENNVYYDSVTGDPSLQGKKFSDELTGKVTKGDTAVGKVERDGAVYYNYVAPFISGNEVSYTIRIGVDVQVIDGEFNRLSRLFIYLGVAGILLGILASYILASRMTRPIVALTESALAIRAGNLNAYPNITTNDELEQLSHEFQRMVEKLKQFYFQEYNQKKQAVDAKKRLEEVNTRLKELDRQKTDFLNAASHQLRTPLSVIHWSLSLIVEEAEKLHIPEQERELLTESLKSTKRMVDLVNDLLDLSRMEQGRKELSWEKANFSQVCDELVRALQPLAANKSLQLTYERCNDIPDSFLDPKAFYQVVNNFVDNAIKYTKEGYVKLNCELVSPDRAEIRITDSGIGMTDEERTRLFTRFSRGEEASKMFANGSGLGMFVAHEILRQHGGEVSVQSEKGKGTTFTLSVPLYQEIPKAPEPKDQPLLEDKNQQADIARIPEKKIDEVASTPPVSDTKEVKVPEHKPEKKAKDHKKGNA
ncbi:MAG TPA: HAMP domain-containing sensor histidine kinase [Verrucomicrobiae bacterium]|nr:HAMP domain-containing sensor histidine kinase [Verrucomicrobiae bacterium]